MTPEQIDNLEAGRELDYLIARDVFTPQTKGELPEPQQPEEQDKPLNQQLEKLFYNRLTNRGKQVLANRAIDDLESLTQARIAEDTPLLELDETPQ